MLCQRTCVDEATVLSERNNGRAYRGYSYTGGNTEFYASSVKASLKLAVGSKFILIVLGCRGQACPWEGVSIKK